MAIVAEYNMPLQLNKNAPVPSFKNEAAHTSKKALAAMPDSMNARYIVKQSVSLA